MRSDHRPEYLSPRGIRHPRRHGYSIQGWRQHRIDPDFIFTARSGPQVREHDRVYVVETKGIHLKDNEKTRYIEKIFDICTREAKSRHWSELSLQTKDKVMRFEVLAEDEWQARLNAMIQA